MHTAAKF